MLFKQFKNATAESHDTSNPLSLTLGHHTRRAFFTKHRQVRKEVDETVHNNTTMIVSTNPS